MRQDRPTPIELAAAPELAVLHALEELADLVGSVLLAAHPDLEQADFFPEAPPLSVDAWLADAILVHLGGLATAVGRYRAHLRGCAALGSVQPPDDF